MRHRTPQRVLIVVFTALIVLCAVSATALIAVLLSARSLPNVAATASPTAESTVVEETAPTANKVAGTLTSQSEPAPSPSEESSTSLPTGAATTVNDQPTATQVAPPSATLTSPAAAPAPAPTAAPTPGGASTPACDGRGVLIIESVVDDGTGAARARIDELLAAHSGSTWYQPGACPSLRGMIDGQAIYPVVVDYGTDFAGLCEAYYAAGSDPSVRNARLLNHQPGAQNPC